MSRVSSVFIYICILLIFFAFISICIFIIYDRKFGGNTLNSQSKVVDGVFYLADKNGNKQEVSENVWKKSQIITMTCFVFVILGAIAGAYLFARYVFIPTMIEHIKFLLKFLRRK